MPYGHGCSPLCEACIGEQLAHHKGTAQLRGERWAERVALRVPRDRPWPTSPKARAIALRKIADLTRDVALRDRLADEVEVGARRWWEG